MSDLIKALQEAMSIAQQVEQAAPVVEQAVTVATDAIASPATKEQDAAAQVTPAKVQEPDVLQKVESVAEAALPVVGLIPGLQAAHVVELLTTATQLVNVVERIKTHVQQNAPQEWAHIESVFSSAVGAFHAIPKA